MPSSHLITLGRTARIPSTGYNNATDMLKCDEIIQDNALVVGMFVLSELVICSALV
jgi:hypothetical protein